MQKIALRLSDFFVAHGYLDESKKQVAIYGFDLTLYTALSTLGLALLGVALGRPLEALLIVAFFYLNQTFGGGFHAKSHLRCFTMMFLVLFLGLVTGPWPSLLEGLLALLSLACLFAFPLVLHPNKQYLSGKRDLFVRRSRILVLCEAAFFCALFFFLSPALRHAAAMGLLFSALSRAVGALRRRCRG